MSSLISSAFQYVFGKEKKYILMLGLNNAGKTTILNGLKLAEVVSSTPSIGFNVEKMKSKNINIVSWDLGNKDKQHPLWRSYCQNTENLIFVVDSSDHERIDKAREELQQLLSEPALKDIHLLIYANKKDLSNAMNVAEITDKLDLHSLNNRQWYVQVTCATSGDGLFDGLDWLSKQSKNIK